MFLMDYKERTKAQLLQDIAALHQQNDELKALEHEGRMQAEDLQSLNEGIDRQRKDLEILHTITDAVHQSFDLQHVYNTALDMATTLQDVDIAFIYMISEDRKEAILQAHRNLTEDYIHRAGRIPYPKATTWKVLNSGQVLNIKDIQKDKDIGPAGKDLGHRRSLGIPIVLEGIVMGVIWLASFKEGKFSEEEIEYRKQAEGEIRLVREQHEIVYAIKNILKDEQYITSSLAEKLAGDVGKEMAAHHPPHKVLSDREYKVMTMIASGISIKDIATEIYLSASTVSTYRARILGKLNLKTNAELIRYAIKHNLTVYPPHRVAIQLQKKGTFSYRLLL